MISIVSICLNCDDKLGFPTMAEIEQKGSHIVIHCKVCKAHMMLEFKNYLEIESKNIKP